MKVYSFIAVTYLAQNGCQVGEISPLFCLGGLRRFLRRRLCLNYVYLVQFCRSRNGCVDVSENRISAGN